jgi:MinD superfamily P-loop ATPase
MHDMERIVGLATHFGVKATACINKYDINRKNTREIESYCNHNGVELLGKIPYDNYVIEALVQGIPVVEHPRAVASQQIETIWHRTLKILSS